jgi:hypothetical protein
MSDKVEITPAMIEAGAEELAQFSPRRDSLEAAVVLIYEAMERARAKSAASPTSA